MPAKGYTKVCTLTMPLKFFKALERCLAKVDMKGHANDFEMLYVIYDALRTHHKPKKTVVKVKPIKRKKQR